MKRILDSYVPRHIRLGVSCSVPDVQSYQDVVVDVPVVDNGILVQTYKSVKSVSASEVMSKYKVSQFRLSALLQAGVPLKVININHSDQFTVDQLESICMKLENAEAYVNRIQQQHDERNSWFTPVVEDSNSSDSNV